MQSLTSPLANLERQASRLDALIPVLTDDEARGVAETYRKELTVRIMRLRNAEMFAQVLP